MRQLVLCFVAFSGCAHGQEQALAVLAVSADEIALEYAEAKKRRLVYCEATVSTEDEAKTCMGAFYGDRGTHLLEAVVAAQKAMTEGVKALEELRMRMEDSKR